MQRYLISLSVLLSCACASQAPAPSAEADEATAPASQAVAAVELEEQPGARAEPAAGAFVVHEWGTFTARLDSGGNLREWTPSDRVEPLPEFVLENWISGSKQQARGTVRMETPVLYFYSDTPLRASAKVEFPGGFLTEWYPSATHEDTAELATLTWPIVEVSPGPDPDYPVAGDSHYYAARETNAAPLRVPGADGDQQEKMLFYRGVGSFELPLAGRATKRGIELSPTRALEGVIVLQRSKDKLGFAVLPNLDAVQDMPLPALDDDLEQLRAAVREQLLGQGLYAREADAMIETWQALWFEDGLRVLYMVPREMTDAVLPLTLEPAPDELVRVLVGRLDFPEPG